MGGARRRWGGRGSRAEGGARRGGTGGGERGRPQEGQEERRGGARGREGVDGEDGGHEREHGRGRDAHADDERHERLAEARPVERPQVGAREDERAVLAALVDDPARLHDARRDGGQDARDGEGEEAARLDVDEELGLRGVGRHARVEEREDAREARDERRERDPAHGPPRGLRVVHDPPSGEQRGHAARGAGGDPADDPDDERPDEVERRVDAGHQVPPLITVAGLQVGLMICYDIRFPELARRLAAEGADVLVLPSAWLRGPLKERHWELLTCARALENTCYMVAVGECGPKNTGNSLVADPLGVIIASAGEAAGLLFADVDPQRIRYARQIVPVLENRRFATPQLRDN